MEKQLESSIQINEDTWKKLSSEAWFCRQKARVFGETKVGATVISSQGKIFSGCNIEHKFRSHDIHAETSAISSLVASGNNELRAILVVAEREDFTPCGGCMDWVFELGGPNCLVGFQNKPDGAITKYHAKDLMPHYPQ